MRKKRPLKALVEIFHTVFINPDIYYHGIINDRMTRKGRYVIVSNYCGTKVALFQTIFHYSVPIYVWIYENGVKELGPKP